MKTNPIHLKRESMLAYLALLTLLPGMPAARAQSANAAPIVTKDKTNVATNYGSLATNSGTFSDPNGDSVSFSASLGTVTQTLTGTWSYQQTFPQGGAPIELGLDAQENLYVVNENGTLYKYNSSGTLVQTWGIPGSSKGLAVDAVNGVIYVVTGPSNSVLKYSLSGAPLGALVNNGLSNPHCAAVDSAGNIYVTDVNNAAVKVYNSSGALLRQWGGGGNAAGKFNFPQGIRISADGRVYVADRGNNRVQYFTTSGSYLGAWGSAGSGNGQFSSPAGIGIDPSGNVYVGDIGNNRVQKFTANGIFVDKFGPGSGSGQLTLPHGTVFPQAGRSIYVASWGNGRVQKYTTPGTWNWAYTPPAGPGGVNTVTITATDSAGASSNTTFTLNVTGNPVADAGPDQAVGEGNTVFLTAAASHDTNTPVRPLSYAWNQVSGPAVTLLNPLSAAPSFTAPSVPAAGATLVFRMDASNGVFSANDTVTVSVANVNTPPTANAGSDQSVAENSPVSLHGSGVDADGDSLTLTWTQVGGPAAVLAGADTPNPTFTAPPVSFAQGSVDLTFRLTVNDGQVSSGPDEVTVHVFNVNAPPVANAGIDQSVNENDLVNLTGTASSDPDGNTLTYSWTQIAGSPAVTLAGANSATPSFTAPEVNVGGATLTFQLTVEDGELSSSATVNVRISNVNHAPLADAGLDQTVPENATATLDASQSADVDGDALTYSWVQIGGMPVALSSSNAAVATFTTPDVGTTGETLTFKLTVDDGYGGVTTDETAVTVAYVNRVPTVSAGASQSVNEGETVTLGAAASDPDGNPLIYHWTQVSGPAVTLSDAFSPAPTFSAPAVTRFGDSVVLRASVDDGFGGAASGEVTVQIANINRVPSAQAPANLTVAEGSPVQLIGQGTDPDTEEQSQLVYQWQQIAPVAGPVVSGSSLEFTAPLVTGDGDPEAQATLTFRLTTTDPNGAAASDDVDVVVTNVPYDPTAIAGGNLTANEAASVTLNGSASSDPDDDALTFAWTQESGPAVVLSDANTAYPYFTAPFVAVTGATLKFKLTVNDGFGGVSSDTTTVTVLNINDPPIAGGASASIATLWPPDHRMVPVTINGIVDPNGNATVAITGVTQDEPANGMGDGDTAIDAIISPDGASVLLRAERSGKGDGRVYRVSFTVSDFEGSASGVVKVSVPKSKKTDAAVDSGGAFDSTR